MIKNELAAICIAVRHPPSYKYYAHFLGYVNCAKLKYTNTPFIWSL